MKLDKEVKKQIDEETKEYHNGYRDGMTVGFWFGVGTALFVIALLTILFPLPK